MENQEPAVVHIAIPCLDLDASVRFYGDSLGCPLARRYGDRVTFNFFGAQLVCHLACPEEVPATPKMYPRHFGITLASEGEFLELLEKLQERRADFFAPPFVRFPGKREEHRSFFLKDPANNVIEFKWYRDPEMRF